MSPILKTRRWFWMPALGLIPFLIAVTVTLFQVLGGADASTVVRPLIFMTIVAGFLAQVPSSRPFPVVAELGATWEPMGNAVTKILEGAASSQDALTEAAGLINTSNNK